MTQLLDTIRSYIKPWRKWLYMLLFLLLFLIHVWQVPLPLVVLLVVIAAIALGSTGTQLIVLALSCIPMFTMVQYLYVLAICIALYCVQHPRRLQWDWGLAAFGLLLIWELLHSGGEHASLWGGIRMVAPLLFSVFLMMQKDVRFQYPRIARAFAAMVLAMSVVVLFQTAARAELSVFEYIFKGSRFGIVHHPVQRIVVMNPNSWSSICLIATVPLVQLWITGKGYKADLVVAGLLLLVGLLTQSKTFLLCLAVAVMLFLLILFPSPKALKRALIIVGICAAVGLLMGWILFPTVVGALLKRLFQFDTENGRLAIFWQYTQYVFTNPKVLFFGIGAQGVASKIPENFIDVPHNGIQEIVVVWGLVGLALFGLYVFTYLHSAHKRMPRQKLINYIPFLLLALKVQLGQLVTSGYTLMLLAFAFLSLCYDFYEAPGKRLRQKDLRR